MPYSTSFDGAADTVVGTAQGWSLVGNTANNFARLDGAGGLRILPSGGLNSTVHARNEATSNQFAEVVLGANFAVMSALCFVRGNLISGQGRGWCLNYRLESNQLRLVSGTSTITLIPSSACVAGDTVRIEASGADQIRVYRNGALIYTYTSTARASNVSVGFQAASGTTGYDDVIRSFNSGVLVTDAEAPVVTDLTLTATSPTTLTGGFSSNEAGLVSSVAYPVIQAEPTDAQVVLGQNADGLPADSAILGQAMTAGANSLLFTGVDPGTEYTFKIVVRDNVPNVAPGVEFSGSAITPALPLKVVRTFYQAADGTVPVGTYTGLTVKWWDAWDHDPTTPPDVVLTGRSITDGVFDEQITGAEGPSGRVGWIHIGKSNGIPDDIAGSFNFSGPVALVN